MVENVLHIERKVLKEKNLTFDNKKMYYLYWSYFKIDYLGCNLNALGVKMWPNVAAAVKKYVFIILAGHTMFIDDR